MPVSRGEADEILAGLDRTLHNMGLQNTEYPELITQARSLVLAHIEKVDEDHVFHFLAGLFMGNSLACVWGDMPNTLYFRRYFIAVRSTIVGALSLLDDPPLTDEVPAFVDWDKMMSQVQDWASGQAT